VSAPATRVAAVAAEEVRAARRATLWRGALAVWAKEVRAEWRSRYSVGSSIVFAAATLAVLTLAVGFQARRPELASALLWIVLLFSATASLGHGFAREVEGGTWDLLRQAAGPGEVLLGKWLAAATLLAAIEAVILAMGAVLIGPTVKNPLGFLAVLGLGSLSLAAGLPLVGALLAQARRHGGLVAVMAFPLLVPGLLAAVMGTRQAMQGGWPVGEMRMLIAFTGLLVVAGWRLFEFIWDE
jgi:heme exporter protein B